MYKSFLKTLLLFFIFLSFCFLSFSLEVNKKIREANNLYRKGKYLEAIKKYEEASIQKPDWDVLNFNHGTALYKNKDYLKAENSFRKAMATESKRLEEDALYNLGNCKYRLAKTIAQENPYRAVDLLKDSLNYYKNVLELNPQDNQARFNYEFVERELKELLQKLKNIPQQEERNLEQKESQGKDTPGGSKEKIESKEAKGEGSKRREDKGDDSQQNMREKESSPQEEGGSEKDPLKEPFFAQQNGWQDKDLSADEAKAVLERILEPEGIPSYLSREPLNLEEVEKDW